MPSILLFLASLSLLHSGYSTYEFNKFIKLTNNQLAVPKDIIVELAISLLLFTYYAFSQIKPTVKLSLVDPKREVKSKFKLSEINMEDSLALDETKGGNVYSAVENRVNFMDLETKRRQFKEWENKVSKEED